ncbi:MAG: hypothetical protein JWP18_501, partial [Solirubrobacterales bacterium]|nr:hypothetical protein [Solirubrobacterales bacterium]
DLLRRVGLPRGVHLLAPGGHAPEPQFWAGVALVTGSSVVTLAGDAHGHTAAGALLQALQTHAVTSTVLDATQLRGLLALPGSVTDAADLTALGRVVVVGPLDRPLVTAAADLLGEDVLHAVYATTQTGPVAHADTVALHDDPTGAGAPLDGVTVTVDADGALLVRSPLAADGALGDGVTRGPWPAPPAWRDAPVPTGHRGMLTSDGRVRVTGTVHPGDARD